MAGGVEYELEGPLEDDIAGTASLPSPSLVVKPDEKGSKLLYDDTLVGRLDGDRITLNLGWMAAAGFHVTVEADPKVDKRRTGVVLER